jgi:hypothetical protein
MFTRSSSLFQGYSSVVSLKYCRGAEKPIFLFIYIFAVRRYNAFLHAMTAHGGGEWVEWGSEEI